MKAGAWVLVCGPSGAGKDSVIAWAQQRLAGDSRIVFARRMVTRSPGPALEHDEVSRATVHRLAQAGKLAWRWEANGHLYAVPNHYEVDLESGRIVVVNGSREHAAAVIPRAGVHVVLVTAPPELLQQRMHARGREGRDAIAGRLARSETLPELRADLVISNVGTVEAAGAQLAAWLEAMAT
jgi:ribose 1,5-bisphosphokinase